MGAIFTPEMGYGAARGFQDAEKQRMEGEAFVGDQAIRAERLKQEQETGPLRRRALEVGIEAHERAAAREPLQDELARLNVDIAKMTKEEREDATKRLAEARKKQEAISNGFRNYHRSGNPQHVMDAADQFAPAETRGQAKAVREADGTITLTIPGIDTPQTFKAAKGPDGKMRTADDLFSAWVMRDLDPVAHLQEELKQQYAIEKEGAKQSAIGERQTALELQKAIRERDRAGERVTRERARRVASDMRGISREVESSLKTTSIPGHFANTYSSEDDAKLLPVIKDRAAQIYKKGDEDEDESVTPQFASRRAIEEVRTAFAGAKKKATDAAAALVKAGIDPTDGEAVAAAAKKGDKAAKELISALGEVKRDFGADVGKYLFDALPRAKKR